VTTQGKAVNFNLFYQWKRRFSSDGLIREELAQGNEQEREHKVELSEQIQRVTRIHEMGILRDTQKNSFIG
jgi:hypothetical protein